MNARKLEKELPENMLMEKKETFDHTLLINMLKKLMVEKGIYSETELAKQVNLPQTTIHRILSGETSDPRASTLSAIAAFFGISISQLIGEEIISSSLTSRISIPLVSWSNITQGTNKISELNSSNWNEWVTVEKGNRCCYALRSRASMEARFPRGTILVIDAELEPGDGDYIVVHAKGAQEATLREYFLDGHIKYLKPLTTENFGYELFAEPLRCLGVLIQTQLTFHEPKQ